MKSVGIGNIGGKTTTSAAQQIQNNFFRDRDRDRNTKTDTVTQGLGAPTKPPVGQEEEDEGGISGFMDSIANWFNMSGASEPKPQPPVSGVSIYDRDEFKPFSYDPNTNTSKISGIPTGVDMRSSDEIMADIDAMLDRSDDTSYKNVYESTYDEVPQSLKGVDDFKAREAMTEGINNTIKGIMEREGKEYKDMKDTINNTIKGIMESTTGLTETQAALRKGLDKIKGGESFEVADNRNLIDTLKNLIGLGDKTTPTSTNVTSDTTNKENVKAVQQYLTDSGYDPKGVDGIIGNNTKKAIQRFQANNKLPITGKLDDSTKELINSGNAKGITSKKVGNLTIATGNRDDHSRNIPLISTDFNGSDNPTASGVEVILPPAIYNAGAGNEYYDAAVKYTNLVKGFLEEKGYGGDYPNRGVKPPQKDKQGNYRGATNVIHTEPFFTKDTKAAKIINENFSEFANLYKEAFGNVDAKVIAPHGSISSKGIQDKGATSSVFGTELDFGNKIVEELM